MNRYLPENYRFADKKFDCDRKRVKCVTRFCRPVYDFADQFNVSTNLVSEMKACLSVGS